jgi:pyruvate dehydrogenase phosphatase
MDVSESLTHSSLSAEFSGWATSAVLRQALIPFVSNAVSRVGASASSELIDSAIKSAFNSLDARIMNEAKRVAEGNSEPCSAAAVAAIAPALSGSCALLSIYDPSSSTVRTAVTGDSRAVLGSWSSEADSYYAEALSKDQTGFNQDEVTRIAKAHPGEIGDIIDPKSGRLLGMAVTRGFGDHRWKLTEEAVKTLQGDYFSYQPRPKYKSPPYMTAEPEIVTRKVGTKDFVILASDGLWDVISNEDAVACVSRWLAARRAGKPETVVDGKTVLSVGPDGWPSYKATPEYFAVEDLDNAAVCLVKNALGGSRRTLFCGSVTAYSPVSRYVRDDMTVQVVFFQDPSGTTK